MLCELEKLTRVELTSVSWKLWVESEYSLKIFGFWSLGGANSENPGFDWKRQESITVGRWAVAPDDDWMQVCWEEKLSN